MPEMPDIIVCCVLHNPAHFIIQNLLLQMLEMIQCITNSVVLHVVKHSISVHVCGGLVAKIFWWLLNSHPHQSPTHDEH